MLSAKVKVNFNTKHLSKSDPLPPYNGKLRLYNMRFCPFAQRAMLTLIAKNIDYEVVNINLKEKPEWLVTKSVLAKVPALEISDGVYIFESLIIAEYLDEAYPEIPMLPKDPAKKAFDKIIVENCHAQIHSLLVKVMTAPEAITDDVVSPYFKALDFMQTHLQQRGTKFLGGETPGYVDYMIWPWFERTDAMKHKKTKLDEEKFKDLVEYLKNMWQDPVVKEYAVSKQIFKEQVKGFASGKYDIDFDSLLEE